MALNIEEIRQQFPILRRRIRGHKLVYLDSAATSQTPESVMSAMRAFEETQRANVHRGMHVLADEATEAYEQARNTTQTFLHAKHPHEVVFTKNCTEAINLVAACWGRHHLHEGDTVVLSILEHHSNIVPWLMLKEEKGINVEWVDIEDDGTLKLHELDAFLARGNVKLVAFTGLSNVLGTLTPLRTIANKAHAAGAFVLVDAAQLVAHDAMNVQELDCDFLAFSGHKIFGPTGVGVLYGKRELLEEMPPFLGGGGMIREVRRDGFIPGDLPQRFEAGTPPITQAVGLQAAIEWLTQISWDDIRAHEEQLLSAAAQNLRSIESLHILGDNLLPVTCNLPTRKACVSFTLDGIHPHDLTDILGRQGICLRAGHHCAMPLHERLGIPASTRLSVSLYNTPEEIQTTCGTITEARRKFLVTA